jgi:hypothetical protein
MKRRKLLQQLPAWLGAPALAQAPASTKLPVVLTIFARANLGDSETQTRQELARLGWRVATTCVWTFAAATTSSNRGMHRRASWWPCSPRRR